MDELISMYNHFFSRGSREINLREYYARQNLKIFMSALEFH